MNISEPFIRRPIATSLLAVALFLAGAVAYVFLPVARLPNVELPTIHISASQPGADPETMAATVAAPLERRLGEIAGITEMTSYSSLGATSITVQFELGRSIDAAARDVQAAINAAMIDLPSDLPEPPLVPQGQPRRLAGDDPGPDLRHDDAGRPLRRADTVVAQRLSQVAGRGGGERQRRRAAGDPRARPARRAGQARHRPRRGADRHHGRHRDVPAGRHRGAEPRSLPSPPTASSPGPRTMGRSSSRRRRRTIVRLD